MRREQIWLAVLTVALGLGLVGGVVALATLRADLDLLDRQVATLTGEWPSVSSRAGNEWGTGRAPRPGGPTGQVQGVVVLSNTLRITLSVRLAGPGDLLYECPVLRGQGTTYHPTPDSLEAAHFDLLELVTRGTATTTLVFRPAPAGDEKLTLIFNPHHQADDPVAPRWETTVRTR